MTDTTQQRSGAYISTNDIFAEVRLLNNEITVLKTMVKVFSFVVSPVLATLAATLISQMIGV